MHINYLELLAVLLVAKSFLAVREKINVLFHIYNVTAIAFIYRMGGPHFRALSDLAVTLWKWCLARKISIYAEHVPSMENIQADWESTHVSDSSDWALRRDLFLHLEERLGPFSIDLFALRTNTQLPVYCSWRPDPAALTVDGLSLPWTILHTYLFPPFSPITRCLEKIQEDQATAVMIAPVWHNQLWYPLLLERLRDYPILFPPTQDILTNSEGQRHQMALEGHLPLAAWPISGDLTRREFFQKELLKC